MIIYTVPQAKLCGRRSFTGQKSDQTQLPRSAPITSPHRATAKPAYLPHLDLRYGRTLAWECLQRRSKTLQQDFILQRARRPRFDYRNLGSLTCPIQYLPVYCQLHAKQIYSYPPNSPDAHNRKYPVDTRQRLHTQVPRSLLITTLRR